MELRVSRHALRDIRAILNWTTKEFGKNAVLRYWLFSSRRHCLKRRDSERLGFHSVLPSSIIPTMPEDPLEAMRARAQQAAEQTPNISCGPKAMSCEIERPEGWKLIGIETALEMRRKKTWPGGRCIECHEPVRPHRIGTTGQAARFEHLDGNPKCSLSRA
jgi:hypothetical protein